MLIWYEIHFMLVSSIQWLCKLSFYLLMPGNHSTIYIYSIVNRTLWDEEEKLSFGHGQLQNSSYQRTFYCLIQWQYQKIKFSARQYSKISKKLPNFLLSDFGQLHGVRIFSSTNQKGLDEWWEIHRNLFFSCLFWRRVCICMSALQPVNKGRIYFCLCLLVGVHSCSIRVCSDQ